MGECANCLAPSAKRRRPPALAVCRLRVRSSRSAHDRSLSSISAQQTGAAQGLPFIISGNLDVPCVTPCYGGSKGYKHQGTKVFSKNTPTECVGGGLDLIQIGGNVLRSRCRDATRSSNFVISAPRRPLRLADFARTLRRRALGGLALALCVASISFIGDVVPSVPPTAASGSLPAVFDYTGGSQSWTAPQNETVEVLAVGAAGGASGDFRGGDGGAILGTLSVSSGQVLTIGVGGKGGNAQNACCYGYDGGSGGYNAGGGGGGGNYGPNPTPGAREVAVPPPSPPIRPFSSWPVAGADPAGQAAAPVGLVVPVGGHLASLVRRRRRTEAPAVVVAAEPPRKQVGELAAPAIAAPRVATTETAPTDSEVVPAAPRAASSTAGAAGAAAVVEVATTAGEAAGEVPTLVRPTPMPAEEAAAAARATPPRGAPTFAAGAAPTGATASSSSGPRGHWVSPGSRFSPQNSTGAKIPTPRTFATVRSVVRSRSLRGISG